MQARNNFFMSAFPYTDTLYVGYGYTGTALQAEHDCKSHDPFWVMVFGYICGIVGIGTAASWVQIWMYQHLFPWAGRAISMGEGCRGGSGLCHRTRSQDCASSLPPSLTHPCLWTSEWTKEQYTISVSTPCFQSASGPMGLVHFSLGPILQCLLRLSLLFLCFFSVFFSSDFFSGSFISVPSFRKVRDSRILQPICFGWWHKKIENHCFFHLL